MKRSTPRSVLTAGSFFRSNKQLAILESMFLPASEPHQQVEKKVMSSMAHF